MSRTTSSDPTARDFFAGGVDSYLDTITKYAGIGGTEPKLPGYAKLGSATTVINYCSSHFVVNAVSLSIFYVMV